jgi:hypothetical protein
MRCVPLALALWLCAAIAAFAQNAENLPIVGILRINTPDTDPGATGIRNALAALGLVDGRNTKVTAESDSPAEGSGFEPSVPRLG